MLQYLCRRQSLFPFFPLMFMFFDVPAIATAIAAVAMCTTCICNLCRTLHADACLISCISPSNGVSSLCGVVEVFAVFGFVRWVGGVVYPSFSCVWGKRSGVGGCCVFLLQRLAPVKSNQVISPTSPTSVPHMTSNLAHMRESRNTQLYIHTHTHTPFVGE